MPLIERKGQDDHKVAIKNSPNTVEHIEKLRLPRKEIRSVKGLSLNYRKTLKLESTELQLMHFSMVEATSV